MIEQESTLQFLGWAEGQVSQFPPYPFINHDIPHNYLKGYPLIKLPKFDDTVIASNKQAKGLITTNNKEELSPINVSPMVVDKVSIVWKIKPEDMEGIKGYFWNIRMEDKQNGEFLTSGASKKGYSFAYNYRLSSLQIKHKEEKNASNLLIQVDPNCPDRAFLRFEFNPNAVGPEGVETMRTFFEEAWQFLNAHGDYPDPNKFMGITRIDLAVDIHGASMEDLLFFKPHSQKWEVYKEWNIKGHSYIQSLYLGTSQSRKQFCVYDKKAEMKKNGKGELFEERTRIEARIRKPIPLSSIDKLKNPFKNMKILDARLIDTGNKSDEKYSFFIDSVHRRGPQGALKLIQDKNTRTKYREILEDTARVSWWNPEEVFSGLQNVIEKAGLILTNSK